MGDPVRHRISLQNFFKNFIIIANSTSLRTLPPPPPLKLQGQEEGTIGNVVSTPPD